MPPAVFSTLARFLIRGARHEKTEEEISDRTWGCAAAAAWMSTCSRSKHMYSTEEKTAEEISDRTWESNNAFSTLKKVLYLKETKCELFTQQ